MVEEKRLICTACPKGCEATVGREADKIEIRGKVCRNGREYLVQEYLDPRRILTSTVAAEAASWQRLPVRSSRPIPRRKLFEAMAELAGLRVRPPVAIGEVIVQDLAQTGVPLISSAELKDGLPNPPKS